MGTTLEAYPERCWLSVPCPTRRWGRARQRDSRSREWTLRVSRLRTAALFPLPTENNLDLSLLAADPSPRLTRGSFSHAHTEGRQNIPRTQNCFGPERAKPTEPCSQKPPLWREIRMDLGSRGRTAARRGWTSGGNRSSRELWFPACSSHRPIRKRNTSERKDPVTILSAIPTPRCFPRHRGRRRSTSTWNSSAGSSLLPSV